jgi:hypothetical protein
MPNADPYLDGRIGVLSEEKYGNGTVLGYLYLLTWRID